MSPMQNTSKGTAPPGPVAVAAASLESKLGKGKRSRKQKDGSAKQSGGGGKSGIRRKRWRPEELDPMIAAEDAELKVRVGDVRSACGREVGV